MILMEMERLMGWSKKRNEVEGNGLYTPRVKGKR
jgi:hypothetical protein